jgi:hypothetical protein
MFNQIFCARRRHQENSRQTGFLITEIDVKLPFCTLRKLVWEWWHKFTRSSFRRWKEANEQFLHFCHLVPAATGWSPDSFWTTWKIQIFFLVPEIKYQLSVQCCHVYSNTKENHVLNSDMLTRNLDTNPLHNTLIGKISL